MPPLRRSLLENDAYSAMADLAGADAEVSPVQSLLPTRCTYPRDSDLGVVAGGPLTEQFRRPRKASLFSKQNNTQGLPRAQSNIVFLPTSEMT